MVRGPRQGLGADEWRDGDYAGAVQGYTAEPKVGWCAPPLVPRAGNGVRGLSAQRAQRRMHLCALAGCWLPF